MKKDFDYVRDCSFEQALSAIKDGQVVTRATMEHEVIFAQVPANIGEEVIPKMTSLSNTHKDMLFNKKVSTLHYNKQLLIVNTINGDARQYMPNADDLFANDWIIYYTD